ncbi:MAG TPA: hypothetical protein VNZ01_04805 [Solirubrobacteraceae bacterium]|jgi:hypothetical protein|nr:hypothetical protein [Solirubrobacteraceae bacterium]
MKKKLLIGLLSVLSAGAMSAAAASAAPFPQFWTTSAKTTLLRSVTSLPKNQPDAMQFSNEGPVVFILSSREKAIVCNEVELGTTVLVNSGELETKLALPFGVAEGDNCVQEVASGGTIDVPTYFDTLATGAVPATITVTGGPPFIATVHKLKLSHNKAGTFCTSNLEGIKGEIKNVAEGFVEESPPNLNLSFEGVPIAVTCGSVKTGGVLIAHFFLDTMSTTTDTTFIG